MTNPEDDLSKVLSKVPFPDKGTDEKVAREIIETVLNLMLNRHSYELSEAGYLKRKFSKDGGWKNGKPSKSLQLKFDLMDEAVEKLTKPIAEKLKEHREKL